MDGKSIAWKRAEELAPHVNGASPTDCLLSQLQWSNLTDARITKSQDLLSARLKAHHLLPDAIF